MLDSQTRPSRGLGDHLERAWVYPILVAPVRQQVEVVDHYPGSSGYVQERVEEGCCDDLDQGGFGNAKGYLLLHMSRRRGL